uniref:Uncharacterized protein n=1 Tax=Lepeophtheirus salmonis TaxID=72036 RepID=A0A0K2TRJ7_LEPSM
MDDCSSFQWKENISTSEEIIMAKIMKCDFILRSITTFLGL